MESIKPEKLKNDGPAVMQLFSMPLQGRKEI
jgi:hypothetical protein